MKDQETQQRFIALRVQGWTYDRIAREINVAKRTLINWSRRFRFEIQNLEAIEMEAFQEQLLATRETRARSLGEQLRTVEAELAKRNISELPTSRLFALAESLRRQIRAETGTVTFTSPLSEIPNDEYHEQAQEWKG